MSIYAIADLHLSLSVGESKTMEVFGGWENYVEKIEKNWVRTVSRTDTVVVAGDLSWAMKLEEAYRDFLFLENLPGRKILIKGNHDYWWSSKSKINQYLKEKDFLSISIIYNSAETAENYAICGTRGWFLESKEREDAKILNREIGRLKRSIEIGKQTGLEPVVFLHYPPVYDNFECEEILNVLLENKIKRCYYGHLHGRVSGKKAKVGEYRGIDFRLISSDQINFTPVLVE